MTRVPDCFNVIVVEEAPGVIMDDTGWGTSGPTPPPPPPPSSHVWMLSGARFIRSGSVGPRLTVPESVVCLVGGQGFCHPAHIARPAHSVTVATAPRGEESPTYCGCRHRLEDGAGCHSDNPSQFSVSLTNTSLEQIIYWELNKISGFEAWKPIKSQIAIDQILGRYMSSQFFGLPGKEK